MNSQMYNGTRFEVWSSERTWFWLVANDYCGGAIGAAASEPEAVREARRSIEELCSNSSNNELNPAQPCKRSILCG
jgi:hypothetical protein